MPKAQLGDVEIHYESHGSGDPVLLVPGLGGVGSYWNPNLPAFSAKHRVLDRGGHCASETVLEEFNKEVLAFIES